MVNMKTYVLTFEAENEIDLVRDDWFELKAVEEYVDLDDCETDYFREGIGVECQVIEFKEKE